MKNMEQIHSIETKRKITDAICAVCGEDLSVTYVEAWYQLIINEANTVLYEEYTIDVYSNELYFRQYGEKEYFHDDSSQARKMVCLEAISEEEYEAAKTCRCDNVEADSTNYSNWLDCGTERFLTYWQGRSDDYVYYAANVFGVSFVKVTIEKCY